MSRRLVVGLALALWAGVARAQSAQGFALQTYEPPPAGDRFFTVPGADAPGHLAPAAGLVLSWAREPLVLQLDHVTIPGGRVVHRQFWGFAQGSLALWNRVLLDAAVPVALYQSGSHPFSNLSQVSAAGAGDLKLGARTPVGALGPVALAVGVDAWLPTGSRAAFTSDGSARGQLKLLGGGTSGRLEYGGELGYLHRSSKDVIITRTGPGLTFAGAAAWRLGAFRVGPELFGRWQFEGKDAAPVEALLGGHWRRGPLDAGVAVGTSFDRSPGASPLRVIAQLSWRPEGPPPGPSAEELARAAAARAAAEQAEAERLAAERAAADRAEAERLAAERARLTADRDGDGIPDVEDACPDVKGLPSVEPSRHGCPAPVEAPPPPSPSPPPAAPALVKLTREKIEILQAVQFETAKDVIRSESEALLVEVAGVLQGHPELTKVKVEGHTDSQGGKDLNVALSERRAQAVKRWLVERGGVDAARLTTEGFGPNRPVDSNATPAGRARNRRVEFRILEQR